MRLPKRRSRKRTSSIRRRLEHSYALGAMLLVLVAVVTTLVMAPRALEAALRDGMRERSLTMVRTLRPIAESTLQHDHSSAFQAAVETLAGDGSILYVRIEGEQGRIVAQAGPLLLSEPLPALPQRLNAPMSRVLRGVLLEGYDEPVAVTEGLAPIHLREGPVARGTLRVGLSREPLMTAISRVRRGSWLSGLVAAALALIGSRWLAARTAAPLRRLAEGAAAVAAGDRAVRVPVSGAREMAELGDAFNTMIERLHAKEAESESYEGALKQLNDTLEQKFAERSRALDETQSHYRTLVEQSPEAILILQRGRLRFVNRAFCDTFDVDELEALGADFRFDDLFDPAHRHQVRTAVDAWLAGETPLPAEIRLVANDGGARWMEMRGSRIEYCGQPAVECLLLDVTDARRIREQLDDHERLRGLGELASGVAHDFNNQLGAILGRIQLLRRRTCDDALDQDLEVIEEAAKAGRETVRRVQDFSGLRTDRPVGAVRLDSILGQAIELTRSRWDAADRQDVAPIEVGLSCEDELPPIRGNWTELREVFVNLICNAVDAMPDGGRLSVGCRRHDGRIRVEIRDSGVGMDEATRRRVFDPFFTTKGTLGTGLGMSVAYGIVTRHAGSINVESEMGKGSEFTVEFEAEASIPEARGGDGAAMPSLVRPGRILVIDDEAPIAQLVQDALSCDGHDVEVAGCGTEGVEMASRTAFDLVMTDLGMPDISGWEVATRIHAERPELPVVLVTGWGTTLNPEEVERGGIAAVVHKPFEIKDLIETANRILAIAANSARN